MKQFERLKQKNPNAAVQGEARLKNIMEEAEKMKRQMEDKLKLTLGSITNFIWFN